MASSKGGGYENKQVGEQDKNEDVVATSSDDPSVAPPHQDLKFLSEKCKIETCYALLKTSKTKELDNIPLEKTPEKVAELKNQAYELFAQINYLEHRQGKTTKMKPDDKLTFYVEFKGVLNTATINATGGDSLATIRIKACRLYDEDAIPMKIYDKVKMFKKPVNGEPDPANNLTDIYHGKKSVMNMDGEITLKNND
ncbi:unnamed protein product, partial [Symbiodinium sp. CCMP2456]